MKEVTLFLAATLFIFPTKKVCAAADVQVAGARVMHLSEEDHYDSLRDVLMLCDMKFFNTYIEKYDVDINFIPEANRVRPEGIKPEEWRGCDSLLSLAVHQGRKNAVKYLLSHNADTSIPLHMHSTTYLTPLERARIDQKEIAALLVTYGAQSSDSKKL